MTPIALRREHVRWRDALDMHRPVDPAGLAAFRVLFGLLISAGAVRFLSSGFLDKLYRADSFYFRYPGFAWIPIPSPSVISWLYIAFIVLGVLIALGLFFRVSMWTFVTLFAWVQAIDLTNYLNHYVLVVVLAFLLALSPAHACFSVDARLFKARRHAIPFFYVALLRFQVGCVYVFAALAKVGSDWLVFGQPLGLWLPARDELSWIGPFLSLPFVPVSLSWGGFLYDASIVPLLLWRRTRIAAYVLVLVFHGLTLAFFEIGMFPFIMAVSTTVFFDPSWPRRLLWQKNAWAAAWARPRTPAVSSVAQVAAAAWCMMNVAMPLRCHVLGDNVLWDEAGMRFSWRVMVREKSGTLSYRVTRADGSVVLVSPHEMLSHRQVNEMIGQPDMILQLAHHIRDVYENRGEQVQVRADARVSLNGRPLARFIDPDVDLGRVSDTMGRAAFVLPAPKMMPRPSWQR